MENTGPQNVMPGRRVVALSPMLRCALLFLAGALLSACASQDASNSGPPPAPPRGVQPDTLALTANNFADTDGNRYRDTTNVIVYIFVENHPIPIAAKGSFSFILESLSGQPIAEWRFDEEQTAAALREYGPGPAYLFELSILRADAGIGTDRISETEGEIIATFRPAGLRGREEPAPIRRRGSSLQIGPMWRARQ